MSESRTIRVNNPLHITNTGLTLDAPVYAGGYQIGGPFGLLVNLQLKPSRWHRFWMRVALGWEWVDAT